MPAIELFKKTNRLQNLVKTGSFVIIKRLWKILPRSVYLNNSIHRLNLALTRVCNINCVFCPYQFTKKEEKIHMPNHIFQKVLHDIKEAKIKEIMLSPDLGEPLLAPDFIDKIKQLRGCGVELIDMTTNATLLNKVGIETILRQGPDRINISFPGFDEKMYTKICQKPFYLQTRNNILEILRKNDSMGRPKQINIWLRGNDSIENLMNLPDMKEVRKLASGISVMTEVDDWIGLIKPEMLPSGLKIQQIRPHLTKRPCSILFSLVIHPDGDIHLCSCRNIFMDPTLHIGNIKETTILEAYSQIPGILSKWEKGVIPHICKGCSMYCDPANGVLGRIGEIWARKVFNNYRY